MELSLKVKEGTISYGLGEKTALKKNDRSWVLWNTDAVHYNVNLNLLFLPSDSDGSFVPVLSFCDVCESKRGRFLWSFRGQSFPPCEFKSFFCLSSVRVGAFLVRRSAWRSIGPLSLKGIDLVQGFPMFLRDLWQISQRCSPRVCVAFWNSSASSSLGTWISSVSLVLFSW